MNRAAALFAWLAFSVIAGLPLAVRAQSAPAFDVAPARGVVQRLVPGLAAQMTLGTLPPAEGHERFRIADEHGRLSVRGSSISALLYGMNWYLKYVAKVQVSTDGTRLGHFTHWPLPNHVIERQAAYRYRYALNENTAGYSTPYWHWKRWQHEIDVMALSGINAMIVERGSAAVLYRTFRDFGYSDAAIRAWLTQPAHQNWQLMGNLCCFDGPLGRALMDKRVRSAQRIIRRLRELGITPVLPGFYGIVPADFARRFPHSHVIPQGTWAGFTRPGWLDPRDPMFARIAADYYRHQRELYGDSSIYDMEVFQEGGTPGDVPVGPGARDVQEALERAHPGALWMMLAWQGNPRQALLSGVDRSRLLIIDIDHERVRRDDRWKDFQHAPFLFGGIWEFGGRTTLGTDLDNYTTRLPRMGRSNPNMVGTAVFTEGLDTNPFIFDLFTEMAWHRAPVDAGAWAADYVRRRYGASDPHALAAWRILLRTVFALREQGIVFNSERDAAQESLFDAQPDLDAKQASHWSPEAMRYDPAVFKGALTQMLEVAPALRGTATYRYDLVDIARQALANESRLLLPRIKAAFDAKDRPRFESLTARWLHLMDLQDKLLATNRHFLLGAWLKHVDGWTTDPAEQAKLQYDARSLLTTWGHRKASEGADLHDYGNRDWAGLTRDYYRRRWQLYFEALDASLRTGKPAQAIDWYAFGDAWNHLDTVYPAEPHGDSYVAALEVAKALGVAPARP